MARYLLLYRGGTPPQTEDEGREVMAAWTAWFEDLGPAVVDQGLPTAGGRSLATDGSVAEASAADVTGYTILEAEGLEPAVEMARSCPHLQAGGSVSVLATMEVM
jgi:hypothetical protein